jgi:hypothetical protein
MNNLHLSFDNAKLKILLNCITPFGEAIKVAFKRQLELTHAHSKLLKVRVFANTCWRSSLQSDTVALWLSAYTVKNS